jgi:hypothetical protein
MRATLSASVRSITFCTRAEIRDLDVQVARTELPDRLHHLRDRSDRAVGEQPGESPAEHQHDGHHGAARQERVEECGADPGRRHDDAHHAFGSAERNARPVLAGLDEREQLRLAVLLRIADHSNEFGEVLARRSVGPLLDSGSPLREGELRNRNRLLEEEQPPASGVDRDVNDVRVRQGGAYRLSQVLGRLRQQPEPQPRTHEGRERVELGARLQIHLCGRDHVQRSRSPDPEQQDRNDGSDQQVGADAEGPSRSWAHRSPVSDWSYSGTSGWREWGLS